MHPFFIGAVVRQCKSCHNLRFKINHVLLKLQFLLSPLLKALNQKYLDAPNRQQAMRDATSTTTTTPPPLLVTFLDESDLAELLHVNRENGR